MEGNTNTHQSARLAYVFPGQGAQHVGMGAELYQSSRAARDVFDQVDEILGSPLSKITFLGPSEELEKTINSQPAIMATSLACLKAVEELDHGDVVRPAAMAGHSLGEYTSLVAAGVLDLAQGIRLVRERGRLMQQASEMHPGSMAAILGLDEATVQQVCRETGTQIANINGGDQIVISGDRACVAHAVDLASLRGARRAVSLAVSGAFHSFLMSPAQEGLATAIEALEFRDPAVPIIANSTFTPLTTAQEVKKELLTQLCTCVQWERSVCHMLDSGVSSFIEFGPGKVLGGLIRRISASPMYRPMSVEVMNVADPPSAQKVAETRATMGIPGPASNAL